MQSEANKNRRILVVDDQQSIHEDFRRILCDKTQNITLELARAAVFGNTENNAHELIKNCSFNFIVDCAFDGHEALEKVVEAARLDKPYALAFVDMRMGKSWDGLQTIEKLWKVQPSLQVVICSAYSDYSWSEIASKLGQTERFLILKKPFDNIEVRQMACSLTEKWELINNLDKMVKDRTLQIAQTRDAAVFVLASLAESRDPENGDHLERIRSYSHILAEELRKGGPYAQWIDDKFLENLYRSSPLHDIGKIGIPDNILLKPGTLTDEEFEVMKQHTVIGWQALGSTMAGECFLQMAADIAKYHHEKYDGSGYPEGLKEEEIPLAARIVALADVFDALTSTRVYKVAFKPELAFTMIKDERGRHFDPLVVDAFVNRYDEFLQVHSLTQLGKEDQELAATAK
ncbi:MAG: HD domain-containing phosphohydrolase [Phycisphaerales bacterium]